MKSIIFFITMVVSSISYADICVIGSTGEAQVNGRVKDTLITLCNRGNPDSSQVIIETATPKLHEVLEAVNILLKKGYIIAAQSGNPHSGYYTLVKYKENAVFNEDDTRTDNTSRGSKRSSPHDSLLNSHGNEIFNNVSR